MNLQVEVIVLTTERGTLNKTPNMKLVPRTLTEARIGIFRLYNSKI